MKALTKRISLILLALLMIVSAIALSACDSGKNGDDDKDDEEDEGQLSGTYILTIDGVEYGTYIFKGNKVTYSFSDNTQVAEYEINGDEITLTLTDETIEELYGVDRSELDEDDYIITQAFEKGDGWIKIGDMKLYKEGADIGGDDNSDSGIGNIPSTGDTTLSGTYKCQFSYGTTITYIFSGNQVTGIMTDEDSTDSETQTATYEIDGDSITFTFEQNGETQSNTCSFEKGDDYIIIDGSTYTKS